MLRLASLHIRRILPGQSTFVSPFRSLFWSKLHTDTAHMPLGHHQMRGPPRKAAGLAHARCTAPLTPWHIPMLAPARRGEEQHRCSHREPWSTHRLGPACLSTASAALSPSSHLEAPVWEPSQEEREQMKRELHSLNVAISANVLICIAKVWVHIISGSSAMLAEAFHSVADILNQCLLRIGVVKAMKAPTAQHPYGYMRDRFVWSLISAVGIFFLGAGASVFHGLHTLTDTRVVEAAWASYMVLGVSGALEGYSLLVAARYVLAGARARGMGFLAYVRAGVDPTTVAVMLEDGGAVAGLAIAAICTALTHATGNAVWDALGSIAVGGLLGLIATFLVQKNRDLLLGRSMSKKEVEEVLNHLRKDPTVLYVAGTKTEEIGPRVFRFTADVAWNADQLVERYIERVGRDNVAQRLQAALDADRQAAQRGLVGQPSQLDRVLKSYGREIISAVGAEVDRLEVELQGVNPGIRWVDLETDRGRIGGWTRSTELDSSPPPPDLPHNGNHSNGSAAGLPPAGPHDSSNGHGHGVARALSPQPAHINGAVDAAAALATTKPH